MCLERCIANQAPKARGGMLVIREPLEQSEKRLAFSRTQSCEPKCSQSGSGRRSCRAVGQLHNLLEEEGVEAVRLDLSVAYHHKGLQPAADEFGDLLEQVEIQAPSDRRAVRLSTDPSRALKNAEEIRSGLRRHLCGQVDFQAAVEQTESMWPGAVYVDVGPRQTGSRLLQANHVDPDRTLRMDDREDPASQPIRIAFKLLSLGFSVDESSLLSCCTARRTSRATERRGRLPYLVNGHAAIPLDGRPMPPSPLVPVLTPS